MGSNERVCENEQLHNYYADSTVFVAVGKHVKESEYVLSWAVQKFAGKKRICILHVHQPPQLVSFFDNKLTVSKFKQRAIKAFQESDIQKLHKLISEYVLFVSQRGMRADRMWIEMENIEDGIVKMIVQHGIKWLVMGAAADKHYTKDMIELKSQKAIFVCSQAPVSCHIWFTCRGKLIHTREGVNNCPDVDMSPANGSQNINMASKESDNIRVEGPSSGFSPKSEPLDINVVTEEVEHLRVDETPTVGGLILDSDVSTEVSESESLESDEISEEEAEFVRVDDPSADILSSESDTVDGERELKRIDHRVDEYRSPPRLTFRERGSILRACSVDFSSEKQMVLSSSQNCSTSYDLVDRENKDHGFESNGQMFKSSTSLKSVLSEGKMAGKAKLQAPREICNKLENAISDAENLKQRAFQESVKRWKAEEDAIDAKRKADAAESKYLEEMKQRKEVEEALAKQKLECGIMKEEHEKYTTELPMVQDQCFGLESQIRESEISAKELEEKIISAVELLKSFRAKRDELELERDKAALELENLSRSKLKRTSALSSIQFSTFSLLEIGEATCSFDPSKRIGDGRYGSIYKGILRHVDVAIRMLPNDGFLSQQMIRHRNIVTLIGICPEARSIVYEYLERGSLEDHLECRGKAQPLQWQTRVLIATELCSALIFFHTNNPPIFHGNLKPTKVLLDANFNSKISDLGIFFLISQNQLPNNSQHYSSVYIDPEFLKTGVLTQYSDIYSFGMIVLRLLTGRPEVVKDVKLAIQKQKFESVLDFSAGDWPINQARALARMALRCCDRNSSKRPDLALDVWSVLEPLRKSCDSQTTCSMKKEYIRPPSHFVCPIYQEVMKEPCTAEDGYTYEGDAIRGWLDSGHTTSPMTNLKLSTCDLIPNYALQYAIQEWQQRL
ncbi:U-box domain-containing protein 33 [Bienertia sinuspersici]